jgi:electron transfer flavoprotein beta subunit
MAPDSAVLVSVGRHPVSLRPRLPELEARAIGLARRAGATVTALHVGPPAMGEGVLRSCLGLGADRAVLIEAGQEDDPLPALLAWLRAEGCQLLLAGARAESGEGSGMIPFRIAEELSMALVARAVALEPGAGRTTVCQAMPGGRRRMLEAVLPLVITVDQTAPVATLSALGPALRGAVLTQGAPAATPDEFHTWHQAPARKRPRRLAAPEADGRREQLRQLLASDPDSAADAILDFLERETILASIAAAPERS